MRPRFAAVLTAAGVFLFASGLALAHHGTAAYDTKNIVTVKGTVVDFRYVNPHVQVSFEVKNEKGEIETWESRLTAPTKLSRAGWDKNTLKPGDPITASGYVAKNDPHNLWITKLIGPSGEELRLNEE